ncbi:MAG TPA: hypothetical protein VGX94_06100 [Terriglobia bacterium]|nr:hypothetical protein [Terriglobia bacterium]
MDKRVEAAMVIIQSEYPKPLRISGLARRVGASRSHLAFLFKKETGLSMRLTFVRSGCTKPGDC